MTTITIDRAVLEQALEALEAMNPYPASKEESRNAALAVLRAALAQQEQEAVAWMFQHEETRRMNYVSNDGCNSPGRFLVMNPRYALVCALYTTPPRREWQSLTEDEIRMAYGNDLKYRDGDYERFARAIEAKLKEKNEL